MKDNAIANNDDTALAGGTTMAMHESQSRFYENIVGRSYPFWSIIILFYNSYFLKIYMM